MLGAGPPKAMMMRPTEGTGTGMGPGAERETGREAVQGGAGGLARGVGVGGGKRFRWLCWAFVVLSAVAFGLRGPLRGVAGGDDFAAPYGATRAWAAGQNPYDAAVLDSVLRASGRELTDSGQARTTVSLYPPPTFLLLAPLSPLSWQAARLVWLLVLLALFVIQLHALLRLGRLRWREPTGLLLVGGALALAPIHTGIALGQLAIASVALLVFAVDRIDRGSKWGGGVALGLAVVAKPQLAGPFLLYFLLRGRWRAAGAAAGLAAGAALGAVAWLHLRGVAWVAALRDNTGSELVGGSLDPSGPLAFQLIDLRPLLVSLTGTVQPGAVSVAVTAALGLVLYGMGRRLPREQDLLLLSALSVLVLFVGYHRFYDAALLVLPMAWAAGAVRRGGGERVLGWAVAACCAVFFVPGAVLLANWGGAPDHGLWRLFAVKHQIWALVVLAGVLFVAVHRQGRGRVEAKGHGPARTGVAPLGSGGGGGA